MRYYKNLKLDNIVEKIDGIVYTEEWRPIEGYEGIYEISSFGRIKSLERLVKACWGSKQLIKSKIKKQSFDKDKYLDVRLNKEAVGVTKKVHRLVALYFIDNPDNKPQVNHKKGIKTDNRKWQLEWSTSKENHAHAFKKLGREGHHAVRGRYGMNPSSKPVICMTNAQIFPSARCASIKLKVLKKGVLDVCHGRIPNTRGYEFKFL